MADPDVCSGALPASGADRTLARTTFVAVVLVVLGLALWAVYRLTGSGEQHSFARGALAPTYVSVTQGDTYSIGIVGGVRELRRRALDPATTACAIAPRGGQSAQLAIVPDRKDTKAVNQIATFVAPVTGRVRVSCTGLPAVFVDDADDRVGDASGLWLVLASIALAVGLPLGLSVIRRQPRPPALVAADLPEDRAKLPAPPG